MRGAPPPSLDSLLPPPPARGPSDLRPADMGNLELGLITTIAVVTAPLWLPFWLIGYVTRLVLSDD